MTCKALFWVDVPCLKGLNSFMLISQAVSLQSVGRAVANRLLGGSTETPALPASGWSSPGELELLIERPRVSVDFFFPTPRFSLKTKQEVGVISELQHGLSPCLYKVRWDVYWSTRPQLTCPKAQWGHRSFLLVLRSLGSGSELPPGTQISLHLTIQLCEGLEEDRHPVLGPTFVAELLCWTEKLITSPGLSFEERKWAVYNR